MRIQPAKVEHLYVHVPFCAAKCGYCGFYSAAGASAKMADYVAAVLRELNAAGNRPDAASGDAAYNSKISQPQVVGPLPPAGDAVVRFTPSHTTAAYSVTNPGDGNVTGAFALAPATIFVGGGTPSLLPVPLMRQLLEGLRQAVALRPVREWTIECNPATVTLEKARLYREFSINRVSLGVQSFADDQLQTLGRIHTSRQALETYARLRAAGFDNINLDLMSGLPGQTLAQWRDTLRQAIEWQPEHLAAYCLTLEEDTPFWRRYADRTLRLGGSLALPLPDEDTQSAMYELTIDMLAAAGYHQYEISNFARPGRECAHNIAYWEGRDYLGLGPSACSTVGDRRWQNIADIDRYLEAFQASETQSSQGRIQSTRKREAVVPFGAPALSFEETLTPALRAAERAAFGMRMTAGVPVALVRGRWDRQIAELLAAGLVQWRDDRLQPTRRGLLFADEVAAEFVGGD